MRAPTEPPYSCPRIDAAIEEIEAEGTGALNNAMPEDAPDIIESMTAKAQRALANVRHQPRDE